MGKDIRKKEVLRKRRDGGCFGEEQSGHVTRERTVRPRTGRSTEGTFVKKAAGRVVRIQGA